jgi:hypothetical protein
MTNKIKYKEIKNLGICLLINSLVWGSYWACKEANKTPLKEPTRQEFQANSLTLENQIISDLNGDGRADTITGAGNQWVAFYKQGLEKTRMNRNILSSYSRPMSSNLEATATALLKYYSELIYQETISK